MELEKFRDLDELPGKGSRDVVASPAFQIARFRVNDHGRVVMSERLYNNLFGLITSLATAATDQTEVSDEAFSQEQADAILEELLGDIAEAG